MKHSSARTRVEEDSGGDHMRMDRPALRPSSDDGEVTRWRTAQENQSLRDTLKDYRTGASALAGRVTALRAEVGRLNAALRDERAARSVVAIEVNLELDRYAPDLVRAVLRAEFSDALPLGVLKDVVLVASELTTASANR